MAHYDIAQLCENGHLITQYAQSSPDSRAPFCSECGSATITTCSNNHPIKGAYHSDMPIIGFFEYDRPSYCEQCGIPYPWTIASLKAAEDLIQLAEGLDQSEKDDFKNAVTALTRDTPQATVATVKYKTYIKKVGGEIGKGIKDVIVDIVSETAKKAIWGV